MKIALYDVDSRIPNLALMKISAYHKSIGDKVSWYSPLLKGTYDKIYASKIFINSDNGYISNDMVQGGSGINLEAKLPEYIEHIYPDYSLYNCDYAMGFITRGCIRNCPFCLVPKKEGSIRKNADIKEFWKDQKKVMLLDNNILAYPQHEQELQHLIDLGIKVDFNQGLDIRLLTESNALLLSKIKKWDGLDIRFAFDDPSLESLVIEKIELLKKVGIKRARFYVLIGFNTTKEQDFRRIEVLKNLNQRIFVMAYQKTLYTIKFQRWVNRHYYRNISFDECY